MFEDQEATLERIARAIAWADGTYPDRLVLKASRAGGTAARVPTWHNYRTAAKAYVVDRDFMATKAPEPFFRPVLVNRGQMKL